MASPEPWYAISLLLNFVALICVCVELNWANLFYEATCFTYYEYSDYGDGATTKQYCWPFFIVAWALALPSAVIAIVASAIFLSLFRKGKSSPGTRRAAVWISVVIALLWLCTILFGWIQPTLPDGTDLPSQDFFGGVDDGSAGYSDGSYASPVITGTFAWCVDYYNAVMQYVGQGYDWTIGSGSVFDAARSGMAAVVTVMIAFSWSIIMVVFAIVYTQPPGPAPPGPRPIDQSQPQVEMVHQVHVQPDSGAGFQKSEYA